MMKLLYCLECGDIFNLKKHDKRCLCGASVGRYTDNKNTIIMGNCVVLGISNSSFRQAYYMQKKEDEQQAALKRRTNSVACCPEGVKFEAFFIPATAASVKRVELKYKKNNETKR